MQHSDDDEFGGRGHVVEGIGPVECDAQASSEYVAAHPDARSPTQLFELVGDGIEKPLCHGL